MKNLIPHFLLFSLLLLLSITLFYIYGKNIWYPYYKTYSYHDTIIPYNEPNTTITKEACKECPKCSQEENLSSTQKLHRYLADANFLIYPKNLTLIGLKHERRLEVWSKKDGKNIHLVDYPFTAFSGILGPKFKEGDKQIPEGIYGISYLNPNSKFHLSLRVNYPNKFDKKMAKKEKRDNLGSDIMIHGSNRTIGCIPIGDDKIEELYLLAQKVGIQNIKVILAPVDFRIMKVNITKKNKHPWLKDLYAEIKKEMKPFISK